jgi:hypothetical protein
MQQRGGDSARGHIWVCEAELLPIPYFYVVFTVLTEVASIAFHNKAVVYGILF